MADMPGDGSDIASAGRRLRVKVLLALILAVTVGPSFLNVVVAISVILWARYARVIRGEVLSLMAEGLSNAGIAQRLVITEGAVEKHVTSIFAKLGLEPAETDHRRVLAVLSYLDDRGP